MTYQIHNSKFVSWAEDQVAWDEPKFHAVLSDPPYGISFMNKEWDKPDAFRRSKNPNDVGRNSVFGRSSRTSPEYLGGLDFQIQVKEWGDALLLLLYPGALVFMFGGTRMWHHLAIGMEAAGFRLWDTMMWLHGQGFPKARDLSKDLGSDWTGYKTPQLKPAWEPILCFKAPSDDTYTELATKYGSGCLNVDSGRIGVGEGGSRDGEESRERRYTEKGATNFAATPGPRGGDVKGRYPANLMLDESSAETLDEQTGILKSGYFNGHRNEPKTKNAYGKFDLKDEAPSREANSGGASRFFYVAKPSQKERNIGLDNINNHPTVKPIDLNTWLASLLLPPKSVSNRRILVPFSGSGSEMIGAIKAGWDEVVGVEMNKEYCQIAESRLKHWLTEEVA